MPCTPQDTMQLRLDFVELAMRAEIPFSELCQRFGYQSPERLQMAQTLPC